MSGRQAADAAEEGREDGGRGERDEGQAGGGGFQHIGALLCLEVRMRLLMLCYV